MILAIKTRFPDGNKTDFENKILKGLKTHTIHPDKKNRWHVGTHIHFIVNHTQPQRRQFGWGVCIDIQPIKILPHIKKIMVNRGAFHGGWVSLDEKESARLALAEGFANVGFLFDFFPDPFSGKLIFWGDILKERPTFKTELAQIEKPRNRY